MFEGLGFEGSRNKRIKRLRGSRTSGLFFKDVEFSMPKVTLQVKPTTLGPKLLVTAAPRIFS